MKIGIRKLHLRHTGLLRKMFDVHFFQQPSTVSRRKNNLGFFRTQQASRIVTRNSADTKKALPSEHFRVKRLLQLIFLGV